MEKPWAAASAPSPVVGRGALSRVSKSTKKKGLDSRLSVARQSHKKRSSATSATIEAAAALKTSVGVGVGVGGIAASALPGLAGGAQGETALLGPQPQWGHTSFPIYGGNIGRPDMSAQVSFPVGMTTRFPPQISDRYQSPWLGDESGNVPSTGSMHSTWDQAGIHHTSPEHHAQTGQLEGVFGATSLSCGYIFPRSCPSNGPSLLPSFTQQDNKGNMEHSPYYDFTDAGAYFGMPTELDSSMDLSPTGEWVVIGNQGQPCETDDAGERGESRSTWLTLDSKPDLFYDSSFLNPEGSPESDASEDYSDDDKDAPVAEHEDLDGPKRRTRKRLNSEERQQTGNTRKIKACVRCRMQKIRCLPDLDDPSSVVCKTCSKVSQKSKKIIHKLPCLRWILTETTICRAEGEELTKRWSGTEMINIGADGWANAELQTIQIRFSGFSQPAEFKVKKFIPIEGDITYRLWKDEKGESQITCLPPYAFRDVNEAAVAYHEFVVIYMLQALQEFVKNENIDEKVRKTYSLMLDALTSIKDSPRTISELNSAEFLRRCIRFWFANRTMLGSATLVDGDPLGMKPDRRPGHPHPNDVSIPRMISAQFNNVAYCTVLRPVRKVLLEELWRMMASKTPQHFFNIYLAVFMLLHEISAITKDRRRWAKDNNIKTQYYSLPNQVEAMQEGANIILSHWHYYRRGFNPLATDWKKARGKKTVWADLTDKEIDHLVEMCRFHKGKPSTIRRDVDGHAELTQDTEPLPTFTAVSCRASDTLDCDSDHYWTRQMFEEDWRPKIPFTR